MFAPLTSIEFAAAMAQTGACENNPHLAIAVSGGADSMALLLLAQQWAKNCNGRITALTVDHSLRNDSKTEALQVHKWCQTLGIAHEILTWIPPKFKSAIQEKARTARYQLLTDWCQKNNVLNLLTAHHRDDQTETLFFRLTRGSGMDGLACMQPFVFIENIRLIRPLLAFPKSRLIATLHAHKQEWLEDPSNQNPHYTRSHIRALLAQCPNYDDISKRAYVITQTLQKFRNRLEYILVTKLAECLVFHEDEPYMQCDVFAQMEQEWQLRILAHIAKMIGNQEHNPRTHKKERFLKQLQSDIANNKKIRRTFGGCLFKIDPKKNIIAIVAENPRKLLADATFLSMTISNE